jgi:predicted amidohydrolase YtcJ
MPFALPDCAPAQVRVGAIADLCMLDAPLAEVLACPVASVVRSTIVNGEVVFERSN